MYDSKLGVSPEPVSSLASVRDCASWCEWALCCVGCLMRRWLNYCLHGCLQQLRWSPVHNCQLTAGAAVHAPPNSLASYIHSSSMLQSIKGSFVLAHPCGWNAAARQLLRGLHTSVALSEPREQVAGQPTHYTHPDVSKCRDWHAIILVQSCIVVLAWARTDQILLLAAVCNGSCACSCRCLDPKSLHLVYT